MSCAVQAWPGPPGQGAHLAGRDDRCQAGGAAVSVPADGRRPRLEAHGLLQLLLHVGLEAEAGARLLVLLGLAATSARQSWASRRAAQASLPASQACLRAPRSAAKMRPSASALEPLLCVPAGCLPLLPMPLAPGSAATPATSRSGSACACVSWSARQPGPTGSPSWLPQICPVPADQNLSVLHLTPDTPGGRTWRRADAQPAGKACPARLPFGQSIPSSSALGSSSNRPQAASQRLLGRSVLVQDPAELDQPGHGVFDPSSPGPGAGPGDPGTRLIGSQGL